MQDTLAPFMASCRTRFTVCAHNTVESVWTVSMAPAVLAVQVSSARGFGALQQG